LPTISPKIGAYKLLVGNAFGIDVGARKVIACQLGDEESEGTV
jgi:hypothetical protein